jgi:Beta propeller domain
MSNRAAAATVGPLVALLLAATTACTGGGDTIGSGVTSEATTASGTGTDSISTGGGTLPPGANLHHDDIVLASALQTVDSCDALLGRIKEEALSRVGPYGLAPSGPVGPVMAAEAEGDLAKGPPTVSQSEGAERTMAQPGAASATSDQAVASQAAAGGPVASQAAAGGPADSGSGGPADSGSGGSADSGSGGSADRGAVAQSGTNNQEAGVDEADLVKSDGRRLVVLSGNLLRVIDLTGPTPVLVRQIVLPAGTSGGELFLEGDTALLMTTGWTDRPYVGRTVPSDWYPGSPTGRLLEIDLKQGEVVRTLDFEGGYLSAREVDGTVRIVVSANADRFAFVYPSNDKALDGARAANRSLIERSTIDQWLPTFQISENGTTVDSGPLVDCSRVYLPKDFAGFGSLVLLTVDPAKGLHIVDAASVFTDAQTVYASTDVVAVATPRWPTYGPDGSIVGDPGDDYTTAVHTFDITDPAKAAYIASGSVPGHVLNQYSLSEYGGYLRVATTAGSPWAGPAGQRMAPGGGSESMVTVLGRDGDALAPVGQVSGLGQGEQIQAVRFLGDKGYVVTFRQTDPLYVLDLKDPAHPKVTGELKIPGFSSYLHPIDETHVLGVGTDGNQQGATGGTVVSMFDVSDPAHPTRTSKLAIGGTGNGPDGGSSTPVANDARAFTWWQDRAVVPVSWWRYETRTGQQSNGSDAVVIDLDSSGQLKELGRVRHPATDQCSYGGVVPEGGGGTAPGQPGPLVGSDSKVALLPAPAPCFTQVPEIVRSLVVGDQLYTVSTAGVAVHQFATLNSVAWIPFG